MWYVYILRSLKNGDLYKGLTDDIERRLKEHNVGKTKTTKCMLPVELVYVEICDSISDARKLEKFYKSGQGRDIIRDLLRMI